MGNNSKQNLCLHFEVSSVTCIGVFLHVELFEHIHVFLPILVVVKYQISVVFSKSVIYSYDYLTYDIISIY